MSMIRASPQLARLSQAATQLNARSLSSSALRRAAASPSPSTASPSSKLDWPTYLALRKSQRRYGLFASIPTTIGGFVLGASYFANIEVEPTELIMGVEPIWVYAGATVGCVGLGWLSGPFFGNGLWKLVHRSRRQAMEIKDKEFYSHVVKHRADPSRQSVSNPVPDYYCEKPGTLKQYRQWLRDQAAYKRKAQFGQGEESVF